jgi:pimeloyl-ACP methyl ester carboxylesterase
MPSEIQPQKSTNGRIHATTRLFRALSSVAPGAAAWLAERLFVTVPPTRNPRRELEWARAAERVELPSAHGTLAAWVWGTGGRTVAMVHGWAGRGLQLGAFAEPLVAAGFRVVAFDGPGHGASPGRTSNLFKLADGVAAADRVFGPTNALIAHSLGAVAALMAITRGKTAVDRMIAVAPPSRTTAMTAWFGEMTGFSPTVVGRMRQRLETRFQFNWDDIEPLRLARELTSPVLVVHDRGDTEIPFRHGRALADACDTSWLIGTSGVGHHRILRNELVVETATRFITGDAAVAPTKAADAA